MHIIACGSEGISECYNFIIDVFPPGEDCSDLPADNGSLLYQFLLQPDSSNIQHLTPDMLQVGDLEGVLLTGSKQ